MNQPQTQSPLRHGRVTFPASRGAVAIDLGLLGGWQVNEMEGGKNFPALAAGPFPAPFDSDNPSVAPPADGFILSGGKADARDCVNFTDEEMSKKLNRAFTWPLLNVDPGQIFKVTWQYTAPHTTRGYRWLITKDGWDPKQRITRAQLEAQPFAEDFYPQVPYYSHAGELKAKVDHQVKLPANKKGRHVIVLMWIVANTGNAFYQAFDVDFK
ncbi:lytic polysaccharide monooxygenase auxiliary activity family 9 protein [Pseudomonas chlororaphis]|jgi:chitin-binding protein|uniref:Lytic polysaccharide monooxygenase n=1 Tax=Pseudomonas chlororaphis subsp. aurantiaca TaxID=86192 RepID=A0AAJ0ZFF1_9PSED|nr:lytic polysaccharide monooxygenase auxiliary activity family 9 protein [Pseudomonas chlororaphis]AZD48810.1 Chitin binding protein [Pseudomonas chlororaphis subsp. aurantiaca]AZD73712.1 Chitin binding protein [Pseudomonas chlororaphis subsp. aurantiaca]AZD79945.1 Chitin binding protein [Pseudomonas chlororaphis subsp. aurantiaca]MBU4631380.1 lytic polysaccharide monooxygenase [Pseudomonas chlororaphis subsp. aurantiaca]